MLKMHQSYFCSTNPDPLDGMEGKKRAVRMDGKKEGRERLGEEGTGKAFLKIWNSSSP